ncbi:hypothetical protein V8C26DRAFT_391658 [Trichoderma gracile]
MKRSDIVMTARNLFAPGTGTTLVVLIVTSRRLVQPKADLVLGIFIEALVSAPRGVTGMSPAVLTPMTLLFLRVTTRLTLILPLDFVPLPLSVLRLPLLP